LDKFKLNTINYAQEVCLAQGRLLFRGLPEDFALQTGAYGAPTPTFLEILPAKGNSAAETPLPKGCKRNTILVLLVVKVVVTRLVLILVVLMLVLIVLLVASRI
jgi:hypothetical protein